MIKSKQLIDYRVSYVVLVSKFLEYFEVDMQRESYETTKSHNEITNVILYKIGQTKVNDDHKIYKSDVAGALGEASDATGPSGIARDNNALIPYVSLVDRGEPLSNLERMMLNRSL